MPVRIYDISKKLGLENKEVLSKAKELGITAARVASSSLDKITAEYLEEQLRKDHPSLSAAAPAAVPAAAVAAAVHEPITVITAPPPEPEPVAPAEPPRPEPVGTSASGLDEPRPGDAAATP